MSTGSAVAQSLEDGKGGVNVARRLTGVAGARPDQVAVAMPGRRDRDGRRQYQTVTFAEFEGDTNRIAAGLRLAGAERGMRLVLLVRPSIDFIALVFAMLKAGVVVVLIDPGMGRKHLLRCLGEVQPDGFIAIPPAQVVRVLMRRRFPNARFNVTVGRRWFWGGRTLDEVRALGEADPFCGSTAADDPAAIIFTTGSTGPPKGVLYSHRNFDQQVAQIRDRYNIQPGEVDVPGFPLFGLFNAAMGVTTVIPDMDPTRPAQVNPAHIVEAVRDWNATQSFGSPALWNVVGRHCRELGIRLPSLRRVLSAGAPVPVGILQAMQEVIADDGEMHTPYGATEALPVASISASEVLGETAARSATGGGTCVGNRFAGIDWKVIRITDKAIERIEDAEELPDGEIGELIVRGPVVTSRYVTRREANRLHKIADGGSFWHRMGDVGYLDSQGRFWFCGRKSHRVVTDWGTMFTVPCEAIFNQQAGVSRSALVGIGAAPGQEPVIIIEPEAKNLTALQRRDLESQLLAVAAENPGTQQIRRLLFHRQFPVDIRHNSKIFREQLAAWAAARLAKQPIDHKPGAP